LAAQQTFQRDIGEAPSILAYPDGALPLPVSSDDAVMLAVSGNPDVVAAVSTSDAAQEAVEDASGASLPTVSVQGALQRQYAAGALPQREDIASVVVQMRIPLYAGGLLSSQYRQAVDTASARNLDLEATRQKVTADARNAWSSWMSAKAAISAAQIEANANAVAQEGVEHARASSERTELDVLNAAQAALQSKFNLLQAQHDELVSRYTLLSAIGRLTAKSLQLPVTIYDPDDHLKAVQHHFYWQ
jgi:outer membrane protein